jgi:KDO2-lipid IV(A) lauroyltransferase
MLNRILFYFFLRPLSFLPLRFLLFLSKFFYFIIYYIFSYRRKVVRENMRLALPEISLARRISLEKGFYIWFTQNSMEILKCFSGNVKFLQRRFHFHHSEIVHQALQDGRHVIMLTSHYGNWEWGSLAMGLEYPGKVMGVYLTMKNHFWNLQFRKMRAQTGNHMVPAREVGIAMKTAKRSAVWCFAADQTPAGPAKSPWIKFMGTHVPWIEGPERLAAVHNAVVVYGHIKRIRRGRYEVTFVPFRGSVQEPGAVTRFAVNSLEEDLHKNPEFWLWSHRRWKHKADKFSHVRWI